jgi:GGDEF domain-containing protein
VAASIGIAASSRGYAHCDEMLGDADRAMYQAKLRGRSLEPLIPAPTPAPPGGRTFAAIETRSSGRRSRPR